MLLIAHSDYLLATHFHIVLLVFFNIMLTVTEHILQVLVVLLRTVVQPWLYFWLIIFFIYQSSRLPCWLPHHHLVHSTSCRPLAPYVHPSPPTYVLVWGRARCTLHEQARCLDNIYSSRSRSKRALVLLVLLRKAYVVCYKRQNCSCLLSVCDPRRCR